MPSRGYARFSVDSTTSPSISCASAKVSAGHSPDARDLNNEHAHTGDDTLRSKYIARCPQPGRGMLRGAEQELRPLLFQLSFQVQGWEC